MIRTLFRPLAGVALALAGPPLLAQDGAPWEAGMEQQREAMAPLAWMDGEWRGTATYRSPQGTYTFVQTERVGPMLDGTLRVIEGRGYDDEGIVRFNAFAILGFDPKTRSYTFRSYTRGQDNGFPAKVEGNRLIWSIPAGEAEMRYTIWRDAEGRWRETGERIAESGEAAVFFEMTLNRIGESDWPASGFVPRDEN